jgi:hypothetical protein
MGLTQTEAWALLKIDIAVTDWVAEPPSPLQVRSRAFMFPIRPFCLVFFRRISQCVMTSGNSFLSVASNNSAKACWP